METPGVSLFAAGIIVRYPFGLKPQTAGGFEVLLKLDLANWPQHKRAPWVEEANALVEDDYNEVLPRMRGTAAPWRQIILTAALGLRLAAACPHPWFPPPFAYGYHWSMALE